MHPGLSIFLRIFIWLIVIIVAWVVLVSTVCFFAYFRPRKIPVRSDPSSLGLAYEKVSFKTEDGVTLSGWFIPAKEKSTSSVILLHGLMSNKEDMLSQVRFLWPFYNLLLFDFRAHGESSGNYTSIGLWEIKDVLAASRWLKEEKSGEARKIGALGFSLGAAVAIMAAGKSEDIGAIVADSSYASFDRMISWVYRRLLFIEKPMTGLAKIIGKLFFKVDVEKIAPKEIVKQTKTPMLLIHGERDSQILPEDSRMIYSARSGPMELWIVEGARHGESYFLQKEEYERRVLDFFKKYLK